MRITMELRGRAELARAMKDAQAQLRTGLRQLTSQTAHAVKADAQVIAPEFSGALRRGITVTTSPRGTVATVRAQVPHAAAVLKGRRAGARMPPKAALVEWARQHGVDPKLVFVLARAIARKGIKARPFFDEAWRRHRPGFDMALKSVVDRVVRSVGSSRPS